MKGEFIPVPTDGVLMMMIALGLVCLLVLFVAFRPIHDLKVFVATRFLSSEQKVLLNDLAEEYCGWWLTSKLQHLTQYNIDATPHMDAGGLLPQDPEPGVDAQGKLVCGCSQDRVCDHHKVVDYTVRSRMSASKIDRLTKACRQSGIPEWRIWLFVPY